VPKNDRQFQADAMEPVRAFVGEQNSRALLVIRNGRIEFEWYSNDWSADKLHGAGSAAKSFTSALVGIAIIEGKVAGTESTLAEWFPEWTSKDPTGHLANATLAHLLTMRSGLPYNNQLQVAMHREKDWLAYIQQQVPVRAPGTQFHYSGFDPILISAILQQATKKSLGEYAEEKLLRPLGIRDAKWQADAQGLTNGGSLLALTARDYARFGLMFLREGKWQDQQLVSTDWVKQSTCNQFAKWPWYGYYWWRLDPKFESTDERLRGCYFASGGGGQHIIVLPKLDIVVVRLGDEPLLTPSGQKFVPELCRRLLNVLP
jgi:CubicO group peptidase (beta-lactamase class C family)